MASAAAVPAGVSVVIPCYNAERYLARAVESVLAQTRPADEVIVVDDGSTDGSAALARGFGGTVRAVSQPNGGVAVARNQGLALARGRWVAFLDADDEWFPHKLERQVAALEASPDLRWCACNAELVAEGGRRPGHVEPAARRWLAAHGSLRYFDVAVWQVFHQTSGMLVEAELMRALGGFDAALRGPEDVDLWCRLALEAPAIAYVPDVCYRYYEDTPGSLGKNRLRSHYQLRSIDKVLGLADAKGGTSREDFRRHARQTAFRLLVAALSGRETLSEEDRSAHLRRLPPTPLQSLVLGTLARLPDGWRRRLDGPVRDAHRSWHRFWHTGRADA